MYSLGVICRCCVKARSHGEKKCLPISMGERRLKKSGLNSRGKSRGIRTIYPWDNRACEKNHRFFFRTSNLETKWKNTHKFLCRLQCFVVCSFSTRKRLRVWSFHYVLSFGPFVNQQETQVRSPLFTWLEWLEGMERNNPFPTSKPSASFWWEQSWLHKGGSAVTGENEISKNWWFVR